jgi:hypothetical protein
VVSQIDAALFEAPILMLASIASKRYSFHNNIQNLSEAEADATTGISCEDGQEKKTAATISTLSTQPSQVGSPYLPVLSSSLVQPKAQKLTRHTHEQSHADVLTDGLGVMRLATSDAVDFLHSTSCLFRYVTIRTPASFISSHNSWRPFRILSIRVPHPLLSLFAPFNGSSQLYSSGSPPSPF